MKPIILPYNNIFPKIDSKAFIAPSASIIGDVEIGAYSGIWFNVVIRGDVASIKIGNGTNIQDGSVIHVTRGGGKTQIGDNVTIGHNAVIHAACLRDNCFVGMGAIVMDNVIIEEGGWLAAGSLLTNNKVVKSGEIWAGSPAKFFRMQTKEESEYILISANNYKKHVDEYKLILANQR